MISRRSLGVGLAAISAAAALGWWAAHGNCHGANHLDSNTGLLLGASTGTAAVIWGYVEYRVRMWPVRYVTSVFVTGYFYAVVMVLTEPVFAGAACEPNYKASTTMLQNGAWWGLFMGTFFFLQPIVARWWSQRSPSGE